MGGRDGRGHNVSFYRYRARVFDDASRMQLVLDRRYMTAAEICDDLRLSRGTVHRMSTGKTQQPRKWGHVEVLRERAPRYGVVELPADVVGGG